MGWFQELERQLATKRASLPDEPAPEDENAVKLVVRMPDNTRRGRRFHKSDKLQVFWLEFQVALWLLSDPVEHLWDLDFNRRERLQLPCWCLFIQFFLSTMHLFQYANGLCVHLQSVFDFIDVLEDVKPGTYRLVSMEAPFRLWHD